MLNTNKEVSDRSCQSRLGKRVLLALLVVATWIPAARVMGSRGEAFWILFPFWVLVGVVVLRVIPAPRAQHQGRWVKWGIQFLVVLLPIGYCFGMAQFMGAEVSWWEILIAVWFFAVSLELLLLYLFQGADRLRQCLARGRGRFGRVACMVISKALLYLLLVAVLLPTLSIHRVKFTAQVPSEEFGMSCESVSFPSRDEPGQQLSAWFFPVKNPQGTVLACHGAGANRGDILGIVWMLHESGFQVLCFDFRGHGESDGHTITFGQRERMDVLGAWDYLVGRPDVDHERIFGYGLSMGAASLLMALPDLPEIKAVVADSAFSSLECMLDHQYRFVPGLLREVPIAVTRGVAWLDAGLRVDAVDVVAAIDGLAVPIFFIHGLEDASIPPDCSQSLYDAYGGPKKLRLVAGAGHGMAANFDSRSYQHEMQAFFLGADPGRR